MEIPFWKKYLLSTEEASSYFNIGINKLRRMIAENPQADWLIKNGSRLCIKRDRFEKFVDSISRI